MDAQASSENPQMKSAIVLRGTAKDGKPGPPVGVVDIGVAEKAFLFRVAVPGVDKEPGKLKCSVGANGRVEIKGEITDRGVLSSSSDVYRMITQQLSPTGPFSVYFNLPGPVDTRFTLANFRQDGILEVIAFKK
ncbi:SHSP domain-containing protein [Psidium guajava]|nr:SHSP domain-containing protein [Psidium guajava]